MTAPQSRQQAGPVLGEEVEREIRRRILDPGAFTARRVVWGGDLETMTAWGAHAVAGYVTALLIQAHADGVEEGRGELTAEWSAPPPPGEADEGEMPITPECIDCGRGRGGVMDQDDPAVRAVDEVLDAWMYSTVSPKETAGEVAVAAYRQWRADERDKMVLDRDHGGAAHAEWSAPPPPGEADEGEMPITPECTDCPRIRDCRAQGYCNRTNRVLPRVTVLSYTPPSGTNEEEGTG